jgi:hypothetical protein
MSRQFQFSLKWLFVAMLVVAAFFGGLGIGLRRAKRMEQVYRDEAERNRALAEEHLRQAEAALLNVRHQAASREPPAT